MKIYRTGTVLGAALLLGLTACGGGDTTTADSATPAATESAAVDTGQGCVVADNTGSSKNKKLQEFAVSQYEMLDCSSQTDLTEQLTTLIQSAEFKKQVDDQGWDSNDGEALGVVTVTIVDVQKRTGCTLSAGESPAKAKTVDCQDL